VGYCRGYSSSSVSAHPVHSRTYESIGIRPGEPSRDVRRRPPTSIDVQCADRASYLLGAHVVHIRPPASMRSHGLLGVHLGVSAPSVGSIPHATTRKNASRCVNADPGSNPGLGFELTTAPCFCSWALSPTPTTGLQIAATAHRTGYRHPQGFRKVSPMCPEHSAL
jgi:hypothetical protein